jgi:hypothetical protein
MSVPDLRCTILRPQANNSPLQPMTWQRNCVRVECLTSIFSMTDRETDFRCKMYFSRPVHPPPRKGRWSSIQYPERCRTSKEFRPALFKRLMAGGAMKPARRPSIRTSSRPLKHSYPSVTASIDTAPSASVAPGPDSFTRFPGPSLMDLLQTTSGSRYPSARNSNRRATQPREKRVSAIAALVVVFTAANSPRNSVPHLCALPGSPAIGLRRWGGYWRKGGRPQTSFAPCSCFSCRRFSRATHPTGRIACDLHYNCHITLGCYPEVSHSDRPEVPS